MLKYKIPFDKKLFIEQTKLTLPYVYKDEYNKVRDSGIIAISLFSIGIIILLFGSELSTLFFAVGIFVVYDIHNKYENYNRLKDGHKRALREYLEDSEFTSFAIFEFRNDCLRFSNDYLSTWIKWDDFETYKIKKSHLLLIQKDKDQEVFVISESEVNEMEFQKIKNFIKERIEKTTYNNTYK